MSSARTPVNVPKWWIDEVEAILTKEGLSRADLARIISGTDVQDADEFKNAKSRVTRFLNNQNTTLEVAEEIRAAIKSAVDIEVRELLVTARDREEADFFALMQRSPARARRALVIDRLLEAGNGTDREAALRELLGLPSPREGEEGQATPPRPKTGRH
jgi:hypothetical protein